MKFLLLTIWWIASILFVYNYFVYPLLVNWLSSKREDEHESQIRAADLLTDFPKVSFIIAAYNEAKVIQQKIENTLAIDYPKDAFEIIVVSDGSSDETHEIASSFPDVIAMHESARGGKSAALNRAVAASSGEILVFSDANNDFSVDSVRQLIRHFEDDDIGAVTGAKHIYENQDRDSSVGDGLYWQYESMIKKAESRLGSITGAEGEILAVRASLYTPIEKHKVNDDQAITFDLVKKGYRVLYEENAKSYEQASIHLQDDIDVKVRMTFGGFQTIAMEWDYLFPPNHWFAFTFWSHKILRWLAPHFLIAIFVTSLMLWEIPFMGLVLLLQILGYGVALYGWRTEDKSKLHKLVYVLMYFVVMNWALFKGFIKYRQDSSQVQWKKAER